MLQISPADIATIGSLGQVVTALCAALIALVAYATGRAFNRSQATKFRVEHINEFNLTIIQLAQVNPTAAEKLGRPVLPGKSDILEDYVNFLRINTAHMQWVFWRRGIIKKQDLVPVLENTADCLSRYSEQYVTAILARGYDAKFGDTVKRKVAAIHRQSNEISIP